MMSEAAEDDEIDKSFTKISDEELEEVKTIYQKGGMPACEELFVRKLDEWKTVPLDVGIIGKSGNGKSCFINAIRGLCAEDEGAAAVGVVETTMEPTPYSHPNNEMLKFWDLPGVGTVNFPQDTYLEKINFKRYDFFLLITSSRFSDQDLWLAQQINKNDKKFYFVRTKVHIDIKNNKKDYPKSHNSKEVFRKIRENIQSNLGDLYKTNKTFLIDSHKTDLYEFKSLGENLLEDFPKRKREAFIRSMTAFSVQMVREKAKVLLSQIWIFAAFSGAIAVIPVPGVSIGADLCIILRQTKVFYNELGLDDVSLERLSRQGSVDVKELKEIRDQRVKNLLTLDGLKEVLMKVPAYIASNTAEEFFRFTSVLGLLSVPISVGTTYYSLKWTLKAMEDVAVTIMKKVVEKVSDHDGH